jgi:hypothetical protein
MKNLLNRWTIVGALAFALFFGLLFLLWIYWTQPVKVPPALTGLEAMTVIPAPSATPPATPTSAPADATAAPPPGADEIAIGGYVQISGTEDQGLRLRADPGLQGKLLFLGYDAEVYLVKDGPRLADDLTWWHLEAPYDATRTGWAAADYLSVIPPP